MGYTGHSLCSLFPFFLFCKRKEALGGKKKSMTGVPLIRLAMLGTSPPGGSLGARKGRDVEGDHKIWETGTNASTSRKTPYKGKIN